MSDANQGDLGGLKQDTRTPSAEESRKKNAKLPDAELSEAPSSEGNANIPECKEASTPGWASELAGRGMLKRQGNKGPV